MDFVNLRYFLTVADRGSFTAAARELGRSQPALSRAIARLEEELGQPVFERQSRRVELTEAGRLLRARAQQALAIVEDARAQITDDGRTGVLRVAAIPTIAPYFLPGALRRFSLRYPGAAVQVVEDVTEGVLRRCDHGEVDLGVVALPVATRYLAVEELFEEELLAVLPRGHPLAGRRGVTLDDMKAHPFILLDEAHCLSQQIVAYCRQRFHQPVATERTSQLATIQELVALGHGVSFVPAMARRLDGSKRRVYRSLAGVRPTRKVGVVRNPYRFQSKLLDAFCALLREGHAKT
jgi:LysR family hydrogen peroxide-inducible transcriptional activator